MWRSLLLGKLAISIVVSLLIGGFCIWSLQKPDLGRGEYFSWLGVGIFFSILAVAQIAMVAMMFRKKKL